MKTNVFLDDELIETALKYSKVKTKKDIINLALKEYVNNRKRKDLLDLIGKIEIDDNYDYKSSRE